MAFEKSKWIWLCGESGPDSYAEFYCPFVYGDGGAVLRISADTDYALFVNGRYAASGQYGDFEWYKIYDEIDLTAMLSEGDNDISVIAYYNGVATSRYRPAEAGLIFEIVTDEGVIAYSDGSTPSRPSACYKSGACIPVSVQLGFTFSYDSTASPREYLPSRIVKKNCRLYPRPIPRQQLLAPRVPAYVKKLSDTRYLVDLGGECVGLPTLEFFTESEQTVTVAFGEHIIDGGVRSRIGARNFLFTYKAHAGDNSFTEYMLRLGCRYLELFCESPISLGQLTLIPQVVPVRERCADISDQVERRIYAACVNTLRLCMMEHYVDCPWREQALYAFDSRNQMLSGYYAFEGMNADYARASLKLISEDRREDGLLSITSPSGVPLAIPAFSLYYLLAVREYVEHTGDASFAREIMPKLSSIVSTFADRVSGGLVRGFTEEDKWSFYDWSEHLNLGCGGSGEPDLMLNCLYVIALDSLEYLCRKVGVPFTREGEAEAVRRAVRGAFLTEGGYSVHSGKEELTSLGQALAILSGVATAERSRKLCEALVRGELSECSLSARVLVYEALMSVDADGYSDFIRADILDSYKPMLDFGSDTVWETARGAEDFSGAGSLCHGWSAVPVYIYHRLGVARYAE